MNCFGGLIDERCSSLIQTSTTSGEGLHRSGVVLWNQLEWEQVESPRFSLTGGPGDLVAVLCLLTIRCHPFFFNPFSALCPYSENTRRVLFFFKNPFISLLLQKYGPHVPTSKSQLFFIQPLQSSWPRFGFFQGLAPIDKELLDKAWNWKCPFLP